MEEKRIKIENKEFKYYVKNGVKGVGLGSLFSLRS